MNVKPEKYGGSIQGQRVLELYWMIDTFKANGVKSYLEIGSRFGKVFDRIVNECGIKRAVSVDLPGGKWGVPASERELKNIIRNLQSHIDAHLFLGDSKNPDIIAAVKELGPFDAVFIDGDHRYDGVKADWINYGNMGRLVGFHDIAGGAQKNPAKPQIECGKLWDEIKNDFYHEECVEKGQNMGIGILWHGLR